ncbi:hypothetical protein SAMN05421678_12142 [Actinopolymorpha cephalotaxi]|uniref:Uncharacterized protein n=1 Tax=Actinopolymorpha cephalotaxi TaxID=504797 RepID=A0A1I3AZ02_9ACTN|nr:hypothetical protein [Actinopolymorpha cephalotaxi]SFH55192.1 hypothetical protein SAMN05421678_12142 [Actinopolymorpha cephalotaxi]
MCTGWGIANAYSWPWWHYLLGGVLFFVGTFGADQIIHSRPPVPSRGKHRQGGRSTTPSEPPAGVAAADELEEDAGRR